MSPRIASSRERRRERRLWASHHPVVASLYFAVMLSLFMLWVLLARWHASASGSPVWIAVGTGFVVAFVGLYLYLHLYIRRPPRL